MACRLKSLIDWSMIADRCRLIVSLQKIAPMKSVDKQNNFERLTEIAQHSGIESTLDFLEQHFRDQQKFFQLFEVLKMRVRHGLSLPLVYGTQPDSLDETGQRKLEDGLLVACGEVGRLLVEAGRLEEGWMYLQPLSDRAFVEAVIRNIPTTEDNIDTIVEIAVSQGAAPVYGYGLLMQHFGTCNAITTFDMQAARFDIVTQRGMAELLLRHLYDELCQNLNHCVTSENETCSDPQNLETLMTEHSWLVDGGAHHIDATHLASVMKIARVVNQPTDLHRALELANYGLGLHPDFQYPSPPPFEATFPDHAVFYSALLGQDVDAAIEYFRHKCEMVDTERFGGVAFETLADLLVRVGRKSAAIEVLTKNVLSKFESQGIAPQVFQIAETESDFEALTKYFREQDDLLGVGICLLHGRR